MPSLTTFRMAEQRLTKILFRMLGQGFKHVGHSKLLGPRPKYLRTQAKVLGPGLKYFSLGLRTWAWAWAQVLGLGPKPKSLGLGPST